MQDYSLHACLTAILHTSFGSSNVMVSRAEADGNVHLNRLCVTLQDPTVRFVVVFLPVTLWVGSVRQ